MYSHVASIEHDNVSQVAVPLYPSSEHRTVSFLSIFAAMGARVATAGRATGSGIAPSSRGSLPLSKLLTRTHEFARRLHIKRLVARVEEQSQRLELTDVSLSEVRKTDQHGHA